MSGGESALESAILAVLAADATVRAVLGDPLRVARGGQRPAYPYIEFARHTSEPADAAGVEGSEHRIDLVVLSRNDDGAGGVAGVAAIREALEEADLVMDGWRCVLLVPVFTDGWRQSLNVRRTLLRLKAVLEAA